MDNAAQEPVTYNLVDKPWVPVIDEAGALQFLGLRDVLADAQRLRSVSGDTPAETIGILRLLLALVQRVYGPASDDDWATIWADGFFDGNTLDAYLASQQHRFDLIDVEHPFMQVPSIVGSVEHSVGRLAMERASRTDPVLFDHRYDATRSPMAAAKAARCLLATQAASPGGLMSGEGPTGLTSAKSTPLLNTAIAVIRGTSLFHTLWLNCVQYDGRERPFPAADDAPAWEWGEITRAGVRMPRGYLDWLTWQARRVRLGAPEVVDGEIVVRTATIMDGWRLPDEANRAAFEQHVGFVRSGDPPVWNALRPESSGLAWRDRLALMAATHPGHRYGALDALAERRLLDIPDLPDPVEIDVLGVGADQSALRSWTDERFSFPAAYANGALFDDLAAAVGYAQRMADWTADIYPGKKATGNSVLFDFACGVLAGSTDRKKMKSAIDLAGLRRRYWDGLAEDWEALVWNLPRDRDAALGSWAGAVRQSAEDGVWMPLYERFWESRPHVIAACDARWHRTAARCRRGFLVEVGLEPERQEAA